MSPREPRRKLAGDVEEVRLYAADPVGNAGPIGDMASGVSGVGDERFPYVKATDEPIKVTIAGGVGRGGIRQPGELVGVMVNDGCE